MHKLAMLLLGIASVQVMAVEKPLSSDPRLGVTMDRFLKGDSGGVFNAPQQNTGSTPLYEGLFKPTLGDWLSGKVALTNTPSGLIHEKSRSVSAAASSFKLPPVRAIVENMADVPLAQYYYKDSRHARLVGEKEKEILEMTHSAGGKVYVSSTIVKVYPVKTYDASVNGTTYAEQSQCADILTRVTVTRVPLVNEFGLKRLVDYWQDFKSYQCHNNGLED